MIKDARVTREGLSIACPLCGKSDKVQQFGRINGYDHFKCKDCHVVYRDAQLPLRLHAIPTEQAAYVRQYLRDRERKLAFARSLLMLACDHFSSPGKLLDVGCAAGLLLEVASEAGWDCWGIEPERAFAAKAAELVGNERVLPSLESLKGAESLFDVIVLANVLSHLPLPLETMQIVRGLLKPSGVIVVVTGNKGELCSRRAGTILGDGWEPAEHIVHFSEVGLRKMCHFTGLRVTKMKRQDSLSVFFSFSSLIGWRDRGWKGLVQWGISHPLACILVKKAIDLYLGNQPRSAVLILVAQRN